METIGEKMSSLRRERGMSQSQLAEAVGVSVVTISNWENGRANPKTGYLLKLAQVLNCGIAYFFEAEIT